MTRSIEVEKRVIKIGNDIQRNRSIAVAAGKILLPTDVIHHGNGIVRIKELLATEERKRAINIIYNHPSKSDVPRQLVSYLWQDPDFKELQMAVPISADEYTEKTETAGNLVGLKEFPVVTPEVYERATEIGHERGYGNIAYAKGIKTISQEGGVNILAPSAGRQSELHVADTNAAELLLTVAGDHTVTLFVGVEINRIRKYDTTKNGGVNVGRKYTLHVGDAYTNEEIAEKLIGYREVKGLPTPRTNRPYRNLDEWIFTQQLPQLVSPYYLPR